jgi:uroporphyrinogen decarboxylase
MPQNFEQIIDAISRRRVPAAVPLYEHFADDQIVEKIMGYDFSRIDAGSPDGQMEVWAKRFEFYRQMGYDYVPVELGPRFAARRDLIGDDTAELSKGKRGWVDEHEGVIHGWADLERAEYWPQGEDAFDFQTFEKLAAIVPAGMKIIGGASGGPFEHASFLVGLERLSMLMYDDEAFIERLFAQIGETLVAVATRLARMEAIGVYRFGDDLGYKTATMLSTRQLRKYVFPWQKRVVAAVHAAGKPFLLHSCGNLEKVMDDLIDDVGIDAKHSWEDVILPVTEAKRRWGGRIAILGGVDVDYLCWHTPAEVREYTLRILKACAPGGGYAAGTGNTVTNYVPVENYLAMLGAVKEYNAM